MYYHYKYQYIIYRYIIYDMDYIMYMYIVYMYIVYTTRVGGRPHFRGKAAVLRLSQNITT